MKIFTAFLITSFLVLVTIQGVYSAQKATGRKNTEFTKPDELWKFAEPMMKPFVGMPSVNPLSADPDIKRLVIVDYLGSSDPHMQDAAVEILAKLGMFYKPIRASAFTKYLSKEYPLNVRIVALSYQMKKMFLFEKYYGMTRDELIEFHKLSIEEQEKIKKQKEEEKASKIKKDYEQWAMILSETIKLKEPPKYFDLLALSLSSSGTKELFSLLKNEEQSLLVNWLLHAMSKMSSEERYMLFGTITFSFENGIKNKAILSWLPTEKNMDARAYVIACLGNMVRSSIAEFKDYESVFELAAQDEDKDIAQKAQSLLEDLRKKWQEK